MKRGNKKKKGISPVIATVLLIAMVVVIGLIVFLWFRGLVQEEGTKFGKNIKLNCADVIFDTSYSNGKINIINNGNIPIYSIKAKIFRDGSFETQDLEDSGLTQGQTYSESINAEGAEKILLIPILLGSSSEGQKTYTCEDQYGEEIII